jgi:rhodanese-related sulfurtransferase
MKSQKKLSALFIILMLVATLIGAGRSQALAQQTDSSGPIEAVFDVQPILQKFVSTIPDGFWGVKPEDALKALQSDPKPFLIDVRDTKDFGDGGYIAGAVHMPLRELTRSVHKLPPKDQPIIVYCAIGHRGSQALMILRLLGYTNVKSIFGGFNSWKALKLPVAEGTPVAAQVGVGNIPDVNPYLFMMLDKYATTLPDDFFVSPPANVLKGQQENPVPFLLDVREPSELTANGYIKNAVNVPIRKLFESWDKLPKDKNAPIVTYCAIGHRGGIAMMTLRLLGYTNVTSIAGGFNNWTKSGLPVVK